MKPELLAPAKNLERLKVAILYGADAVYVGGQQYGLRTRADNFTDDALVEAVAFAHQHKARVYLTLNAFLHDEDLDGFSEYCQFLQTIGVDAVIVSDAGVLRRVQQACSLDIHLSTQASCLNAYAARVWQKLGVTRIIVGRELTVEEAAQLQSQSGVAVEMFIHGAMCMAYSGHCTISNFTAGRDSNRGGCSQSCRFGYQLSTPTETSRPLSTPMLPFMSSKDLWGGAQIPAFFTNQICSLKIEGRMKSSFYVATTCKVYRRLIDAYAAGIWNEALWQEAALELQSIPHRDYFSGSLDSPAGEDSVFSQIDGNNTGSHQFVGMVLDTTGESVVVRLSAPLRLGDPLEFLPFSHHAVSWTVDKMYAVTGESLSSIHQDGVVCFPKTPALKGIEVMNVVRAIAPHVT